MLAAFWALPVSRMIAVGCPLRYALTSLATTSAALLAKLEELATRTNALSAITVREGLDRHAFDT